MKIISPFPILLSFLSLTLLAGITGPAPVSAQEPVKPVRGNLLLSGNFGELRSTHFHSGLDIRTGGVEGWPVICVKDGVVARVSVSPTGYGNALYIEHPDGTTSVYGHLKRFARPVREQVRRLQYAEESFRLDEDFRKYGIRFSKGDTIAFSGNTGSSGGPHLHFELRNTETEHPLNPLLYYSIRDKRPPVVRTLYIYEVSPDGVVARPRAVTPKKLPSGVYDAGRISVPAGRVGIGVFATDYMDGSWNKLGVYRLTLKAGGRTCYVLQSDSSSFGQRQFIHEVKDFALSRKKETVYRCFGNYQQDCMGVKSCPDKGLLTLAKDSSLRVECCLEDINGNRSLLKFVLAGKAARQQGDGHGRLLAFDREHVIAHGPWKLELEAGSLYTSLYDGSGLMQDTVKKREVCCLSPEDVPLFKPGRLSVAGRFGKGTVICMLSPSGRAGALATHVTEEGLEAEVRFLGRYVLAVDTTAPAVTSLGCGKDRSYRIRVRDNLSGLDGWRVEVNGQWCLFAYDPRVSRLSASLSEKCFVRGRSNSIRVRAWDAAGNETVREFQLRF